VSRKILFRCDCGPEVGFGHFTRSLSLARALKAKGASISFWGELDAFARAALSKHAIGRLKGAPGGFRGQDAPKALAAAQGFDAFVVDSYALEQGYVDAIADRCALAVFDDQRKLRLAEAALGICFRAGAESAPTGAKKEALGLEYLVVPPELRALREKRLKAEPGPIRRVLVFFSGRAFDPALLAKAVRLCADALPKAEIRYLTRDGRPLEGVPGTALAPTPAVETLYAAADLLVNGGGLVKYEAAYCALPSAALSQTELQDEDTKVLAKLGLTLDLGRAEGFDAEAAKVRLAALAEDPSAQRAAFQKHLDTGSTERLAELVLTL